MEKKKKLWVMDEVGFLTTRFCIVINFLIYSSMMLLALWHLFVPSAFQGPVFVEGSLLLQGRKQTFWVWNATFFSMEPQGFVFSSIINWYEINLCEHYITIRISFRISLPQRWHLKAAHSTQRYSSSIIIHAMQSCDT